MTLKELRQKLEVFNLKAVAQATGIDYQKIYWIASGRRKNPSYEDVCRLVDFVKNHGAQI